jgi:hypothetical protein
MNIEAQARAVNQGPLLDHALAQVISLPPPKGMKERWGIAQQRFEAGDLKGALELWESIASEGYAEAYVELGNIYEIGKGSVPQDFQKAEYWYRRGIEGMNDPYAHFGLGRMYFNGTGVPRDHAKAFEHLVKAESINYPQAQLILGILCQFGWGTSVDLERARALYLAAAAKEYVLAMIQLAQIERKAHNYVAFVKWRFRASRTILKIGRANLADGRLTGMPFHDA